MESELVSGEGCRVHCCLRHNATMRTSVPHARLPHIVYQPVEIITASCVLKVIYYNVLHIRTTRLRANGARFYELLVVFIIQRIHLSYQSITNNRCVFTDARDDLSS